MNPIVMPSGEEQNSKRLSKITASNTNDHKTIEMNQSRKGA